MDHRNYTYPDNLLDGRIILITGASDGIGRALAVHAAGHGAQVILHGRKTAKLESVYDEIDALDGAARPAIAVLDFETAGSEAYTSLADSLIDEFGRLDGLVNNASILGERYSIEQYDAAMWQKVMHVNVTAAFAITQVCLPLLHRSDDASIIFTSRPRSSYSGAAGPTSASWSRERWARARSTRHSSRSTKISLTISGYVPRFSCPNRSRAKWG